MVVVGFKFVYTLLFHDAWGNHFILDTLSKTFFFQFHTSILELKWGFEKNVLLKVSNIFLCPPCIDVTYRRRGLHLFIV